MKHTILILSCAAAMTACGIHTTVGPKPNIKPAMAGNEATQKSIVATRVQIQSAQVNLKAGASALEQVDQYLKQLLNLPPKEQNIVVLAQTQLHRGMTEFAAGAAKIADADARAADASLHNMVTKAALGVLSTEIDKAHDREKALAKDNAKMLPVYKECTAWFDLGSGWYFIKHLVKHLLILAAFAIVVFIILAVASAAGVPGLGFALSFAKRLRGTAASTVSSLSTRATSVVATVRKKIQK